MFYQNRDSDDWKTLELHYNMYDEFEDESLINDYEKFH